MNQEVTQADDDGAEAKRREEEEMKQAEVS
jgi:hypothetical protein